MSWKIEPRRQPSAGRSTAARTSSSSASWIFRVAYPETLEVECPAPHRESGSSARWRLRDARTVSRHDGRLPGLPRRLARRAVDREEVYVATRSGWSARAAPLPRRGKPWWADTGFRRTCRPAPACTRSLRREAVAALAAVRADYPRACRTRANAEAFSPRPGMRAAPRRRGPLMAASSSPASSSASLGGYPGRPRTTSPGSPTSATRSVLRDTEHYSEASTGDGCARPRLWSRRARAADFLARLGLGDRWVFVDTGTAASTGLARAGGRPAARRRPAPERRGRERNRSSAAPGARRRTSTRPRHTPRSAPPRATPSCAPSSTKHEWLSPSARPIARRAPGADGGLPWIRRARGHSGLVPLPVPAMPTRRWALERPAAATSSGRASASMAEANGVARVPRPPGAARRALRDRMDVGRVPGDVPSSSRTDGASSIRSRSPPTVALPRLPPAARAASSPSPRT